ncbi:hypothetical protein COB52_05535 [Candidatus Kaiserbacteria bacterium]|nr:MAG: hypothetical protein COB52_05535 [Candidatus Kaiserbacteria bacterium]
MKKETEYVEIGMFLKGAREKAGLTQGQVAKEFGFTTAQFISNLERGLVSLPAKHIQPLSALYGVKAEKFVDEIVNAYRKRVHRGAGLN